ncbi:Glycerophosphocholine phosphodiesterase [Didymosphaeria variabile]|uniref:Glycerophosphocholine phosphodiesterase n=1 Tax=Didymosphaeria variabile TaxID=1932322 RepID=A0A9W8XLC6_9PLEO|nr:Glycerophosphocholine phosphodiesterase [Didymosphaeria variabile]KAJ4353278.1 Glycerophosphocholine phosphodiesterase [Didymosphaeria variabile]
MKFGHSLSRNQVPEWASSYINYKRLKKLIKTAVESVKSGEDPDLAGKSYRCHVRPWKLTKPTEFFFSLDRNLEDVDGFYNKKYAEYARRLKLLHGRYGRAAQVPEGIDRDEKEDLMGALLEVRSALRNLQWYGEVNRRGFIKITKKLDKKIPGVTTQQRYLQSKVYPKAFAHNIPLGQDLKAINDWLSGLGEVKTFDDTGSSHSAASLGRIPGASLNLPSILLDGVDQAIRADDAQSLSRMVSDISTKHDLAAIATSVQQTLLNFLQRAISCRARLCIVALLPHLTSLEETDDINKRNCIHRLVIAIGRAKTGETQGSEGQILPASSESNFITPAAAPNRLPVLGSTIENESNGLLSDTHEPVQLLDYLLSHLQPSQRSSLRSRDTYGRLPLHYAAQYGFVAVLQTIIKHMRAWDQFDVTAGIDSPAWQDTEGYAPIHLAVIGGHPLATQTLLEAGATANSATTAIPNSGAMLAVATQSNFVRIVKLLVDAGVDVNFQSEQGETALHVAARFGHDESAKALLAGSALHKAEVDIPEKTFGWTPLFIACVDGHVSIVRLLVEHGASIDRADSDGWTPCEHAALRGHMDIIEELKRIAPTKMGNAQVLAPPTQVTSLEERRSKNLSKESSYQQKSIESLKSFGHRYLTDQTMILVSLGSMDPRKDVPAVKLDDIPISDAHATQLDTALSVVVSASGAEGEPTVADLPVQENISTEPITFKTKDISKVKILFDIVPTYAGSNDRIVGRGVALLSTFKTILGSKRIPLQGDLSVPIVAASTMDVIGSVNFNFIVITPFSHPNLSITEQHTYWKTVESTMVIGHRGLGKNTDHRDSLQLGENTISSFIAAANLGAEYVEFDVQLTKDHVPVIYHDFLVSETGIDAPVHTLTYDQFMHLGRRQAPQESNHRSPERSDKVDNPTGRGATRPRSYSMDHGQQKKMHAYHEAQHVERIKHTRDFKDKGFKGNLRGHSIQEPFTTLEEMFAKLPESAGFNIEMKYPMLYESEEQEMDSYAVELNSFVDTVLRMVYDKMGNRNILFSSFNPDICLMLSFKQPSIPVLFLTDAGTSPVGDVRAASLQEAIRFASRWNLLGIETGLVCVSYGTKNNEPKNVQIQKQEGIDAVIVDAVLKVRKGLTAPAEDVTSVNGSATSGNLTASTDASVAADSGVSTASSDGGRDVTQAVANVTI